MTTFLRQAAAGARLLLVATLVLGLAYPAAIWAVGRLVPDRSEGSLLVVDGRVAGSRLVGQSFEGEEWFLPRPSVAGYDALASGASNLGPQSPDLVAQIAQRRAEVAAREGVAADQVPPDAVTTSASGLDPHISPEYAQLQVPRVARARGLAQADVARLVEGHVLGRQWGFLGAPRVNVVELNAALARLGG